MGGGCSIPKKTFQNSAAVMTEVKTVENGTHLNGGQQEKTVVKDEKTRPLRPARLTKTQKNAITSTWSRVKENMTSLGIMTFQSLFALYPEAKKYFRDFEGTESDARMYEKTLKEHALRVISLIDKCCNKLENDGELEAMLSSIGDRHVQYNARADLMPLIGKQFIFSLESMLEDEWSKDKEEAWKAFFLFLVSQMHGGMRRTLDSMVNQLDHVPLTILTDRTDGDTRH